MEKKNIQTLLEVKRFLETQLQQKKEEIKSFEDQIQKIDETIHDHSFKSANNLLQTTDTENFIKEHEETPINNVENTRNIYSSKNKLISKISYGNQTIKLTFLKPETIKLTQELYIEHIVQPILLDFKDMEPNVDVKLQKQAFDEKEYIKSIVLSNVEKFESFEFFFDAIKSILQNK